MMLHATPSQVKSKAKSKSNSKNDDDEDKSDDETPSEGDGEAPAESAKSAKKKLAFPPSEFDTPDLAPKKKMRKRKQFARDILHLALAGDCDPLKEYIDNFDFDERARTKVLTQSEWDSVLPAWTTKTKSRGLKPWMSKTARGEWNISGVCAKVINKAVSIYMDIFGHPPVYEGVRTGTSFSIKSGGIDLYKPFLLTVHRAYCQHINPEVEVGMVAFDQVLQYMNTRPVRLKLLRAVR